MKFNCFLIAISLLVVGCGKGQNNIDPAFQPLYQQFLSDAKANGFDLDSNQGISIQFATLEQPDALGETVGECNMISWGNSSILIDSKYWQYSDSLTREILVYHELGHCVLSEVHTTNRMAIMNAVINNPQGFDANDMPGMIQQLFFDAGDAGR